MASLRKLVESAFTTYLSGESVGCPVYDGMAASDKEAPCVVCAVDSMQEEPMRSGNYAIQVSIQIAASAEESSAFDDICESVKNAIFNDELEANLQTAQSGLTVWGVASPDQVQYSQDEDAWVATHQLVIFCAAHTFDS